MKFIKKNILVILLILGALVQSCQPNIRFASNEIKSKTVRSTKPAVKYDKSKDEKTDETDELNFATNDEFTNALIKEAESWLGVPYIYGGETKSGVDCSGFVSEVYSSVGVMLPRTAAQQYDYVENIDFVNKKAGDLLFFKNNGSVNHVGLYLGQGYMIHASTSSGVVKQNIHDSYYMNKMAGVGRVKVNLSRKD